MTTWTLNGRTWGYRQEDVPGSPYYLMGSQVFKVWHLLMADLAATAVAAAGSAIAANGSATAANGAKAGAEAARDAALGHATDAGTAKTEAEAARDAAQGYAANAGTAKTEAEAARDSAQGHATTASAAKTGAEAARDTAQGHATTAGAAKAGAETARDAAAGSAGAAAADRVQTGADRAATGTALATAQALVGSAGTGTATGLAYGALTKSLVTAADVVAVHIYDTRLDSDGGAWTERQGGSWYWEALNTATRGARRRFPTVALIVGQATSIGNVLIIYDAHDLDANGVPRIWMAFPSTATWWGHPQGLKSVHALNGRVWVVTNTGSDGRGHEINFVGDTIERFGPPGGWSLVRGGIASRATTTLSSAGSGRIKDGTASVQMNAVHARVIPGAPLDSAGLPIPTVAVATTAGVSVIHPWGAVYDITGADFGAVQIAANGRMVIQYAFGTSSQADVGPIPYADLSRTAWRQGVYSRTNIPSFVGGSANNLRQTLAVAGGWAGACDDRLSLLAEDPSNIVNGMVAYVTNSYATGWQPGDIRGAWLCDTATGNVTGSVELAVNGDFSSGTAGLTSVNATLSTSASQLVVSRNAAGNAVADMPVAVTPGQTYSVQVEAAKGTTTGNLNLHVSDGSTGGPVLLNLSSSATSTVFLGQFTAGSAAVFVRLFHSGTVPGETAIFDNLSVRLALPDRSYKGRGLVVNGTVSRTALACGLAAVSATWGAAHRLSMPPHPDFD